jgi:protocatechuate 3,4-dioxygenase beta subunit
MRVLICALALVGTLTATAAGQTSSSVGELSGTASIAGRITLGGMPAPNVVVTLAPFKFDSRHTLSQPDISGIVFKVTTDEDGRYRFANVAAGNYKAAPFAPAHVNAEENKPIAVAEGEAIEGVNFSLRRGGVITGRVTGPNGQPMIGMKVDLYLLNREGQKQPVGGQAYDAQDMFVTDDRGIYRMYGLPAGRYIVGVGQNAHDIANVIFKRRAYAPAYHPDVTEDSKATPVEVKEGAESTGIDIRLGDATRTFKATGRLLDVETGKPIVDAVPFFVPERGAAPPINAPGIGTPTNARGEFTFEGLTTGNYSVQVRFSMDGSSEYYAEPTSFEVTTQDVRGLEIKARRGATITGTVVVDEASDSDLANRLAHARVFALVTRSEGEGEHNQFSESAIAADGSFRLRGLPPGKVRMRVEWWANVSSPSVQRVEHNGVDAQSGLDISAGQQVSGVTIILSPSNGVVRGQVTVEGGALPRGTMLTVWLQAKDDEIDQETMMTEADAHGRFEFRNVRPGNFDISVVVQNAASGLPSGLRKETRQQITVTNSTATEVKLVIDLKSEDKD